MKKVEEESNFFDLNFQQPLKLFSINNIANAEIIEDDIIINEKLSQDNIKSEDNRVIKSNTKTKNRRQCHQKL